jgi:hypothetical protein
VREGETLISRQVWNMDDLQELAESGKKWDTFNVLLLNKLMPGGHLAERYAGTPHLDAADASTFESVVEAFVRSLRMRVAELESIRENLQFYEERGSSTPAPLTMPANPPYVELGFLFIGDLKIRDVLLMDYREAHAAFSGGSPNGAALLAAGVLEGMLLDVPQRPILTADPRFEKLFRGHLKKYGSMRWDRISLDMLLVAASALGVLGEAAAKLASGARDFRDTVHPHNESASGNRARTEEAAILLHVVPLIHRDLQEYSASLERT